ncbi:MAG: diacylglycerol kinase family lipid kinase [Verrucomicrobiae bacterium]|nr:diacylglycerol kinase family lipid kinase [Verrucomicrobiae bacterium]
MERRRPKRIHIIINPAPAKRTPLLATLNSHFRQAGIRWEVSITHGDGDGVTLAKKAVEEGAEVVGVYGGDGTVMEVASGLVGTDVPLLILPGGTGNLVAVELRISPHLEKACQLICGETFKVRRIDVGQMDGHHFLLRVGCGIEPGVVQDATRELKDQFGKWAYVFAAIKRLQESPVADYEIRLDNRETFRAKGVACAVANIGTVGIGRLTLSPEVDVDDGKLDVFFVKKANLEGIVQLAGKMMGLDPRDPEDVAPGLDASQLVNHWHVSEVSIQSEPQLDIQVDGDVIAKTPQTVRVLPSALTVIV